LVLAQPYLVCTSYVDGCHLLLVAGLTALCKTCLRRRGPGTDKRESGELMEPVGMAKVHPLIPSGRPGYVHMYHDQAASQICPERLSDSSGACQ
jgi:hypothetical protein